MRLKLSIVFVWFLPRAHEKLLVNGRFHAALFSFYAKLDGDERRPGSTERFLTNLSKCL